MASRLTAFRGDTITITGTITPASGSTLGTPIDGLELHVKHVITDDAPFITKSVGDGVTVVSESSTAIEWSVTLDPEDTADLTNDELALVFDLELVESTGRRTTVAFGQLVLTPDVGSAA